VISQTIVRDINSIRKLGIEALHEKLKPLGMVEFMRQFHSLDTLTLEDISNEIKKGR
jgi:hypothetical protein